MKVLITGGARFCRHTACRSVPGEQPRCYPCRSCTRTETLHPCRSAIRFCGHNVAGPWQEEIANQDVIINLAGASIFGRWSAAYKKAYPRLENPYHPQCGPGHVSRAGKHAAQYLCHWLLRLPQDEELTEDSPPGNDFLAGLAWIGREKAREAERKGARVVITRFGIVLGRNGGALQQMIPAFKRFVGDLWEAACNGSPGFTCKIWWKRSCSWWTVRT